MDTTDIFKHKGKFFEILQETEKSQSGVMTLGVGRDTGAGDITSYGTLGPIGRLMPLEGSGSRRSIVDTSRVAAPL